MILVGGLGTRLRPLTDRTRKDMLPLVDRPQLAYTFEHLRRLRRHARDRLVRLPADADPGALRRPLRRPPARVQGRGGAARHRRRDPLRRRGDRRAVLRAQRRLAARDRPRRARRVPPRARDAGDDPAHPRRGPDAVRPRARRRRRPRAQLPREAAAGGDRHEPDQRGHVRARAGRARADPARPRRLDRARGLPPARREAAVSTGVALPGYWLDVGTPDAYLQAHRDVLERNFRTELGDALGSDYTLVAHDAQRQPGCPRSCRPSTSARARRSARARGSAAWP